MQVDRFSVDELELLHRLKRLVVRVPRSFRIAGLIQADESSPPLLQTVLAGIDRDADDPSLLMFGSGEGDGSCQGLHKDVLAYVFRVAGRVQVGVAQPENEVGIVMDQASCLGIRVCRSRCPHPTSFRIALNHATLLTYNTIRGGDS